MNENRAAAQGSGNEDVPGNGPFAGTYAVGRLAVTTKDSPYIIPVNYLFFEGSIYFHSALSGRKMNALRVDSRVCFLVDEVGPQVLWAQDCGITQIYRSVICFGKAEVVEGPIEKRRILERMVQKYVPSSYSFPSMRDQNIEKTVVVKIVIESMSGKANALSPAHTVLLNRSSELPNKTFQRTSRKRAAAEG